MIWMASYPRSGNTFLRNVLFEVYGLRSSTYHLENHPLDENWQDFPFVKTHLLPHELPSGYRKFPKIYLLRDGRDAVVSEVHHRQDVYDPESDLGQNLREAIRAAEGSHFGGWSNHVESWTKVADMVIMFDDLIANPIAQCERLRALMDLPVPNNEAVPAFEQLKGGAPEYGSGKNLLNERKAMSGLSTKWFRRGKVNGWKDELSPEMHDLFLLHHGETLHAAGFGVDGEKVPFHHLTGSLLQRKLGKNTQVAPARILVEASKLADPFTDGIKRYTIELLGALHRWPVEGWQIDVAVHGEIFSLEEAVSRSFTWQDKARNKLTRLRNLLKKNLPPSWYGFLAENFPLHRVKNALALISIFRKQPGQINGQGYDLVHVLLPQHMYMVRKFSCKKVCTIHDLTHITVPETHENRNVKKAGNGMEILVKSSTRVITVSGHTAKDLALRFPSLANNARVVHEGVDRSLFHPVANMDLLQSVRRMLGISSDKFMLCVGTIEPRKNLQRTIGAYLQFRQTLREPCHLVITGRSGWKEKVGTGPDHPMGRIISTGYLDDARIAALYTQAHCLLYLSIYEGFGLPVLEAMSCGCPAIAANNTSLPEITGNAALLVDPYSMEAIVAAMEQMMKPEVHRGLKKRTLQQSLQFGWLKCARETAEVYEEVLKGTS